MTTKEITFRKGKHIHSYHYNNSKELIGQIIEQCDSSESNLDLIDALSIVRKLDNATKETTWQTIH